jgi:hypothetical protein
MVQAVEAYKSVTATEEFRNLEWLRMKTAHDEASAIGNAERRGERRGEARGEARANKRWQAEVERLRQRIAILESGQNS